MSEEPVLLAIDADAALARITLNRPERLNSFNRAMHEALAAALDSLEGADPPVRALLLSGAGKGFCAGQDLTDRAVAPGGEAPDLGHSLETRYNPLVRRLRALPMPVVCAVNGVAAGAGANIALACDIVVAARSASFVQPFCKLGLVPDSGGTWLLPRAVGTPRAMGLAMLGERIDAERAKAWGMIWGLRRRRGARRTCPGARRPSRLPADRGARAHEARDPRRRRAHARRAARSRTGPPARGRPQRRLPRRGRRVRGEAPAPVHGPMSGEPEATDEAHDPDEQRRAERSAEAMLARDAASRHLGIALERVAPGSARMRMTVTGTMINGHRSCHGAYLFALADSTFAVACNSANRVAVAASAQIEFLRPARLGDVLHAEADMRHQGRRAGLCDVVVEDGEGRQLALFRGRSHRLDETLFDEAETSEEADVSGKGEAR